VSPESTKALLHAGYKIHVERSTSRIYKDDDFEAAGARLVPAGSWITAPLQDVILGLKELPFNSSPLPHTHIHFEHCYKQQEGWKERLSRFVEGGGKLYDLEFLTNESGRRVAAFGYWAGYAGAAVALLSWSHQLLNPQAAPVPLPVLDSAVSLISHVREALQATLSANNGQYPRIIVLGALGRCGKGAADFCHASGIPGESGLKWDMPETRRGGPFHKIIESDIFINCVYLGAKRISPFVTLDSLSAPGRRLRVICDVTCDSNNENNPSPVYSGYSSFESPTIPISARLNGPELRVVAIDNLPTLVAREASDEFSNLLLPSLLALDQRDVAGVWTRAEQVFNDKVKDLEGEL
jgi:saccharopine dehydrogenase (NAD+, L-lysine-forming)